MSRVLGYLTVAILAMLTSVRVSSGDVRLLVDVIDGEMVISGDGDLISGILISSQSGAIAIDTDVIDVFESAAPFNFVFSATPTEFHIRNDSMFVMLDGSVSISPAFDTAGKRDLEFFFDPPEPVGFVDGETVYVPEPQAWSALLASLPLCHLILRRVNRHRGQFPRNRSHGAQRSGSANHSAFCCNSERFTWP